jgi:hypothetical protein
MKIEDINICGGEIIFWELGSVDVNKSICDQLVELQEDMVLLKYPNGIYLDLGWTHPHKMEGSFKISIIKDEEWQNALERYRFTEIELLVEKLNEFCKKCKKYSELN